MSNTSSHKKKALVVSHTHWDREWRYPVWKNRMLLVEFMDWLLDILEQNKDYGSFLMDGQTIALADYLDVRPEGRERIKAQVQAGRLIIGPWYTLPDLYPVNGECLIRNLLKGIRFSAEFGGHNPVGYHTFGWGQTVQFPQIYHELGIEFLVAAKRITKHRAPHCEFLWESPDGSRILTSRLGQFARQNGFFCIHFPVRLGKSFYDEEYKWDWGKTGVVYHRANEDKALEDYFRIDHEQGYHKDALKDGMMETWENMNETLVPDFRLLMYGCDFTTPNPALPQMIKDANEAIDEIDFSVASLEEYAKGVKERIDLEKVPLVTGELRDGPASAVSGNALSVRIHIKQLNKKVENILIKRTEPLAASMLQLKEEYHTSFFEKAWDYLLLSHPHDSINGVTQDKTVNDNLYRLNQALELSEVIYEKSIEQLLRRLDLSKFAEDDVLLLLHNSQPRPIREVMKIGIDTPSEKNVWDIAAEDTDGQPLAIQFIAREERKAPVNDFEARPWPFFSDRHDIYLDTGEIPAGGYKVIRIVPKSTFWREEEWWPAMRTSQGKEISKQPHTLENDHLKVTVNSDGTFDMTDKVNGRTICNMHAFEDAGDTGDYWAYYPPYHNQVFSSRAGQARIWLEDNGELTATYVVEITMKLPARAEYERVTNQGYGKRSAETVDVVITSRLTLDKDCKHLKIKTAIDNTAEDHRMRVLIPSGIKTNFADAAGHFTVDRRAARPTFNDEGDSYPEMATVPQQQFVSVSDSKYGLSVLNNCLTEYQLLEDENGTLALTLFRSVRNRICTEARVSAVFPQQKGGKLLQTLEYEYAIYPHAGDWVGADVHAEAEKINVKSQALQISAHKGGDQPLSNSFYEIEDPNLVLSCFKKAEDSDNLIVRVYNPTAKTITTNLKIGFSIKKAHWVNINEERRKELTIDNGLILLEVAKGKIYTIELETV
ncbi:MAG: glycoside hydrolase family 38 C-terminal domain-containing protein [Verrucomicrobiota bacterium]